MSLSTRFQHIGLLVPVVALVTAPSGCSSPDASDAGSLRARFPAHADTVLQGSKAFTHADEGFSPDAEEGAESLELTAVLPRDGAGAIRMRAPNGFEVRVRALGTEGTGTLAERAVAYRRAGGTSFWTAVAGGVEEWLRLDAGVARGGVVASWDVEGATLRQEGEIVVLADERGVGRIRVTAPAAYAASGRPLDVRLAIEGGRIQLSVDGGGEEVLVDPSWTATGSLAAPRTYHVATPLSNGKVIVVAGESTSGSYLGTTELYDPATGTWSAGPSLAVARDYLSGTLISGGRFLVAGGYNPTAPYWGTITLADIYNPATNAWTSTGSMSTSRDINTLTWIPGANIALAAGGRTFGGTVYTDTAERWNAATGTWSPAPNMNSIRAFHTAVLLGNGKVLVAGGSDGNNLLASAEVYDPATNAWTPAGTMSKPRYEPRSVWIPSIGKALVVSGYDGAGSYTTSCDLYDPATNSWSPAGSLSYGRMQGTLTMLPNGTVLSTGLSYAAEIYDPATNSWSLGGYHVVDRHQHTASLLANGEVLLAGGLDGSNAPQSSAELFSSAGGIGTPCGSASSCSSGFCVNGVCCNTACTGTCNACSVAAGAPSDGTCAPLTGNACNDGNACTQTDTCQSGVCTGSNPVTCSASDQCHVAGTCNPANGQCSNPAAANGTSCDDGDVCTAGDSCQAGACTPGTPVTTGTCGPPQTICVTIQRGLSGNVADAHIATDKPNNNWGASQSLSSGEVLPGIRHALLAFDLSAIPTSSTVVSATATLDILLYGGSPVRIHEITAPWSEATVTWNNFGGAYVPAVAATLSGAGVAQSADISALVQAWVNGAPNHGVLLERDTPGVTTFSSSEYVSQAARPSLTVCYVPAG